MDSTDELNMSVYLPSSSLPNINCHITSVTRQLEDLIVLKLFRPIENRFIKNTICPVTAATTGSAMTLKSQFTT